MQYKPLLYILGVIIAIWLLRCLLTGTIHVYAFLGWNLFLASIPLTIQTLIPRIRQHTTGIKRKLSLIASGGIWLLFLPNAFYLLSDFMHLNPQVLVNKRADENHYAIHYARGDAIYMLDSLLLVSATLFGAIVGGIALHYAYRSLRYRFQKFVSLTVISIGMFLVSTGVYIGRYGRWNSWDAIYRPWDVCIDLINTLSDPAILYRFIIVILTFTVFQMLCLWGASFFNSVYKKNRV